MATTPKTLTYEEWLEMPVKHDAVEEVVNGEIRIMPPNKINHAIVVENLMAMIRPGINRALTHVFSSVFGLVIRREPLVCRVPNIVMIEISTMVEHEGYVHSAPQLVIEVLSPSETRGEITAKLRDYASIGVPEVWLVSPEARTIEVLQLEAGRLETRTLTNQGTLSPVHFPQVGIEISSIWPE